MIALTTIKPQVTALAIFFLLLWSLSLWRDRRGFWLRTNRDGRFLLIGTATAVPAPLDTSRGFAPSWPTGTTRGHRS